MGLAQYKTPLTYLLFILLYASVAVRGLMAYYENRRELCGVFAVLVAVYFDLFLPKYVSIM